MYQRVNFFELTLIELKGILCIIQIKKLYSSYDFYLINVFFEAW